MHSTSKPRRVKPGVVGLSPSFQWPLRQRYQTQVRQSKIPSEKKLNTRISPQKTMTFIFGKKNFADVFITGRTTCAWPSTSSLNEAAGLEAGDRERGPLWDICSWPF